MNDKIFRWKENEEWALQLAEEKQHFSEHAQELQDTIKVTNVKVVLLRAVGQTLPFTPSLIVETHRCWLVAALGGKWVIDSAALSWLFIEPWWRDQDHAWPSV